MSISERVFALAKEQKKTQGDIAVAVNVRQATVSAWKSKGIIPSAEFIAPLAAYLGVSCDYLAAGKESANVISNVGDSNFNVANSSNNNFFEKRQQLGEIEAELLNICSKLNTMKKAELLFLARDLMNNGKL